MNDMQLAMLKELELRKYFLDNDQIETIYFGGGLPKSFA